MTGFDPAELARLADAATPVGFALRFLRIDSVNFLDYVWTHRAAIVAAVEAAQPRTITTVEELDALPVGTVIVYPDADTIYQLVDEGVGDPPVWWNDGRQDPNFPHPDDFPATVLYTPGEPT